MCLIPTTAVALFLEFYLVFQIYERCYHDLIHELPEDKKKCIEDIGNWIIKRV